MLAGLSITEGTLGRTRNRAVLPLLAVAMRSKSTDVRATAIRATIRRHDVDSHTQLIRQFHELTDVDRAVVRDAHHSMPHHAARALKNAVLEGDHTLCSNACDLIVLTRDYDQVATLVRATEKPQHRHASM